MLTEQTGTQGQERGFIDIMERSGTSLDSKMYMTFHTSEAVAKYWEYFKPALERGKVTWGEYETIDSLYENFARGAIQLWSLATGPVIKLLAVSRIDQYPTGKRELILQYLIGEGFFEDEELMGKLSEQFEVFARLNNCTSIRVNTVKGLLKPLENMGYKAGTEIVVRKDVLVKERMN